MGRPQRVGGRAPRWLAFGTVGLAGFVTQVTAQWIMLGVWHLPVAGATALATELAVVQNYFWHARYTWSDRQGNGAAGVRQFARFNLGAGATAVLGNVLLMSLLVEGAGVHWLLAQGASIAMCALANYWIGDVMVFRPPTGEGDAMRPGGTGRAGRCAWILALALGACALAGASATAADLQPETIAAFERYARATESRLDAELAGNAPFLRLDTLAGRGRDEALARLRRGEVVVTRQPPAEVPGGLCHDWIGTVLIPGARLEEVAALMRAYDGYADLYRPAVRKSRLVSREGDRFRTYLQLYARKVISVVLNANYDVLYLPGGPQRMQVRSWTTRIAEVQEPDAASEREKPVGHDSGFLWRMNTYCSLDQRDAGTYVQCESVSLSRGIPTGLGWLIGPFVTSLPRDSLEFTLQALRAGVVGRR